jgi:hypothetical protein
MTKLHILIVVVM